MIKLVIDRHLHESPIMRRADRRDESRFDKTVARMATNGWDKNYRSSAVREWKSRRPGRNAERADEEVRDGHVDTEVIWRVGIENIET